MVMLVGLRGHWKATISYYLIRSLSAEALCLHCLSKIRLQSAFPKVHFSEGSLFRRFIVPKKRFIVRRFIGPKGHLSEIGVHCSEGSMFRRFIVPK